MACWPIETKAVVLSKDGTIRTDIVCTTYSDRHFVVVSQIKKFGTLINAWATERADGTKMYDMQTLLGRRDDPLLNVYARQLIERIAAASNKPLLLAISLCPDGRDTETFQAILNEIVSNNSWQ
jgi:proteasome assembly chaperone 3